MRISTKYIYPIVTKYLPEKLELENRFNFFLFFGWGAFTVNSKSN
jgi:hypothetical protein